MVKKEKELEEEITALLKKSREIDDKEEAFHGKGVRGEALPEALRFRQSRLQKIREAKEALEAAAKEKVQIEEKRASQNGSNKTVGGKKSKAVLGKPKPKAQRNFSDPESKIMRDGATKEFIQGDNAQAAVDGADQVIVAAEVSDAANDKNQLAPMLEQIEKNLKDRPKELSADAGYYSESNVNLLTDKSITPLIPPGKTKHGDQKKPVVRGRIPKSLSVRDRMLRRLATKSGGARYKLRKEVVEPVFGQIKQVRGFRTFLLRGLSQVQSEWRLICLTHNLLKLFRSGYAFTT